MELTRFTHKDWYEILRDEGVYWAKFWSTSGKDYARTPKQVIKLILEDHYKKKYK